MGAGTEILTCIKAVISYVLATLDDNDFPPCEKGERIRGIL